MFRVALTLGVLLGTGGRLLADENWPGWRGPRGDGSSLDQTVPLTWDGPSGKNIRWKARIPGVGHSSPVVWGDRVFVTSCLPDEGARLLTCLNAVDGSVQWSRVALTSPLESKHHLNSYASSTPATDGRLVYISFLETDGRTVPAPNVSKPRPVTPGTMYIAAYDFEGQLQWTARPGSFISAHGYCSNPVLFEDLVIINGDHDGESYVLALNHDNGKTVWKTPRQHKTRSYVTPLIREIDGEPQMVFSGSKRVIGMDPRTGHVLWNVEGPTEQFVASMVYDGTRFFLAGGFPTYHVMAIDPRGRGDVTDSHIAWHFTRVRCYVPSPVLSDNLLLVADDRGTANCFDAKTGERLWNDRLGNHFTASLVSVQGKVLFVADNGETTVVEPGSSLKIVGTNKLGERCFSSPAIANGQLYLRGAEHLFCIGTGPSTDSE